MKTNKIIKIFLASSEELSDDRNAFGNLVRRLDSIYSKVGVRIELILWEDLNASYKGRRTQDVYNEIISECNMFAAIFHKQAGKFTIEEFNVARECFEKNTFPEVYTYMKNVTLDESETLELTEFKKKLYEELGHYWCNYSNVDTLQLHFVMQLHHVQNELSVKIEVDDSQILLNEHIIADLRKVPFVACNKQYIDYCERMKKIKKNIERLEAIPEGDLDEMSQDFLLEFRKSYADLYDGLVKLENDLLDTAVNIVSLHGKASSERLRRAVECFERGDNIKADAILDPAEIESDAKKSVKNYKAGKEISEKSQNAVRDNIREWKIKAMNIMLLENTNNLQDACVYYNKRIAFAKDVELPISECVDIALEYALFLQKNNQYYIAIRVYEDLLKDVNASRIAGNIMLELIARAQNNLAMMYVETNNFDQAEALFNKALKTQQELQVCTKSDTILIDISKTQNNISSFLFQVERFEESEVYAMDALNTLNSFEGVRNTTYTDVICQININIANIYTETNRCVEAERIYIDILEQMESAGNLSRDRYNLGIAEIQNNLGHLYTKTGDFKKAEEMLSLCIDRTMKLSKGNAHVYLPRLSEAMTQLADLYNAIDIGVSKSRIYHLKAKSIYCQACKILKLLSADNKYAYLNKLADIQFKLGLYSEAKDNYMILAKDNNPKYQSKVVQCFCRLSCYIPELLNFMMTLDDDYYLNYHSDLDIFGYNIRCGDGSDEYKKLAFDFLNLLQSYADKYQDIFLIYLARIQFLIGSGFNLYSRSDKTGLNLLYAANKNCEILKSMQLDTENSIMIQSQCVEFYYLIGDVYMHHKEYKLAHKNLVMSSNLFRNTAIKKSYFSDTYLEYELTRELKKVELYLADGGDSANTITKTDAMVYRETGDYTIPFGVHTIAAYAFDSSICTTLTLPESLVEIGDCAFSGSEMPNELVIPSNVKVINNGVFSYSSLKNVELPEGLQYINDEAFLSSDIVSIKVPNQVKYIGTSAFGNCRNLTNVYLPENLLIFGSYVFADCVNLISIEITDGSKTVNEGFLSECHKLSYVYIPNTVEVIETYAFYKCLSLPSIVIPSGVRSICDFAFNSCRELSYIHLPLTLQTIGVSAFSSCEKLCRITIPDSVSNVGIYAFGWCKNLKEVILSKGMNTIECNVFENCVALERVVFPDGIRCIQSKAFLNCKKLKHITIPSSMHTISGDAFDGCCSLDSITSNSSKFMYDDGIVYTDNKQTISFALPRIKGAVYISDKVKTLGENAFSSCSEITSIILSDSVKEMGSYMFNGCTSLREVRFAGGVNVIQDDTFSDCISLRSINIPATITMLGTRAFSNCKNLVSISIQNKEITLSSEYVVPFEGCSSLSVIYIPKGSLAYFSSIFIQYSDLLVEVDFNSDNKWLTYEDEGNSYYLSGNYSKAIDSYLDNMRLCKNMYGVDHHSTQVLFCYFKTICVEKIEKTNIDGECFKYRLKLLEATETIKGFLHEDTGVCYFEIGNAYIDALDYNMALEYLQKCLNIRIELFGESIEGVAAVYNNIGYVYNELKNYIKAIEFYKYSIAIGVELMTDYASQLSDSYYNISKSYYCIQKYDSAKEFIEKALAIRQGLFKEDENRIVSAKTLYDKILNEN